MGNHVREVIGTEWRSQSYVQKPNWFAEQAYLGI